MAGTITKQDMETLQSGPAFPTSQPLLVTQSELEVRLASGSEEYELRAGDIVAGSVARDAPLTVTLDPGLNELCTVYPETPEGTTSVDEPESFQCIDVAYITD